MNDDPYGNLLPSSSVLPLPLALLLFLLFFVLGALFAMCESAAETANESRIKKDAESGEPRAKKLPEPLARRAATTFTTYSSAPRSPRLPLPCFRHCLAHCCAQVFI